MGSGYSGYAATGRTAKEAIYRLMNKVGYQNDGTANFGFAYGTKAHWEETSDGFFITNVVVKEGPLESDYRRAEINRLWSGRSNCYYYRAWFGLGLEPVAGETRRNTFSSPSNFDQNQEVNRFLNQNPKIVQSPQNTTLNSNKYVTTTRY